MKISELIGATITDIVRDDFGIICFMTDKGRIMAIELGDNVHVSDIEGNRCENDVQQSPFEEFAKRSVMTP